MLNTTILKIVTECIAPGLRQIALEEGCTVSTGYLAALQILTEKYKGLSSEILPSENVTFRDWLRRSRAAERSGSAQLGPVRVVFAFGEAAVPAASKNVGPNPILSLTECGNLIEAEWQAQKSENEPDLIVRVVCHFEALLANLAAQPDEPAGNVEFLTAAEREQILTVWNRTVTNFPHSATVHELFTAQAQQTPDAAAVSGGGKCLTYADLDRVSSRMADFLAGRGVVPGKVVGLSIERSVELVTAMLAVLKCGACYLPIDASYPVHRQRLMVEDAAPVLILADAANVAAVCGNACPTVDLDEAKREAASEQTELSFFPLTSEAPAYIIYTSGSTGNPKGVIISHRAIVRLVRNTNYIEIGNADCIAQMATASFDAITFEVWGALLNGGRVEILPATVMLAPTLLAAAIREKKITVMFLTTALFNLVARSEPRAFAPLRCLLMGGEAATPECQREVLATAPPARMLHVYGPTENTTFSLWHPIEQVLPGAATIPIGKPISNTEAYVVDHWMKLVPVGVEGELLLGGDGLALGYLNRPDLTGERFIPNPFPDAEGAKVYRTGDRVRYLEGGAIEFLGRSDHQIKLRGHRIELGEIEAALREHPGVSECVVVVVSPDGGERRLAAYAAGRGPLHPSASDLRRHLQNILPSYMVPASFTFMDALPLTQSGKIDRNASFPSPRETDLAGAASGSEIQKEIAAIWCRRLENPNIGIDENFFDAGGDSLTLSAIAAEIQRGLCPGIQIISLFQFPTIRSLASHIEAEKGTAASSPTDQTAKVKLPSRTELARRRAAQWKNAVANRA
jgi:amino acid adenylation domain-containing protein